MNSWEEKALAIAEDLGITAPAEAVLACIYSETGGRNVGGDGGRAAGYGQVWIKWPGHFKSLVRAAAFVGITLPGNTPPETPAEEKPYIALIHKHDNLSMALAVLVIDGKFVEACRRRNKYPGETGFDLVETYRDFTRLYVGSGIPAADLARRMRDFETYCRRMEAERAAEGGNDWQGSQFASEIREVMERGIMAGYTGDIFAPSQVVTRGELAAVVARLIWELEKK